MGAFASMKALGEALHRIQSVPCMWNLPAQLIKKPSLPQGFGIP